MTRMWSLAVVAVFAGMVLGCSDEDGGKKRARKSGGTIDGPAIADVDPERGRSVYGSTCVSCHGQRGQGMPNQGIAIRKSKFIAEKSDNDLLEYLKVGRATNAPDNTSGILMPARGGNQALDDAQLMDVVAYLRVLQKEEAETD